MDLESVWLDQRQQFKQCCKVTTYKNMIGDIMGVGAVPFDHYDPIAGEALNIRGDLSKAKSMGWEPKKDIKDTIKETIVYLENEISEGTIDPLTFMEDLEIEKVKI